MYDTEQISPPIQADTVFVKIIGSLPLQDRRNIRLTCKLWYELSQWPEIVSREKFVFRSRYQNRMEFLGESIMKCDFIRPHLEFSALCMWKLPPDVWKYLGNGVKKILFTDCLLDEEVISNILVHCTRSDICFKADFPYPRKIVDPGSTLGILMRNEGLENSEKVQQIGDTANQPLWSWLTNGYNKMIRTALGMNATIQPLTYDALVGPPLWLSAFCKLEAKNRSRYSFVVGNARKRTDFQILKNYYFNQSSSLTTITLWMLSRRYEDRNVKDLLLTILTALPKLQVLKFSFPGAWIKFTHRQLERFLKGITCLETLTIALAQLNLAGGELESKDNIICEKLKTLIIEFDNRPDPCENIQRQIVCRSPHIDYLVLNNPGERHLSFILSPERQLKWLRIRYNDRNECGNAGFLIGKDPNNRSATCVYIDREYLYKKFKTLQWLSIEISDEVATFSCENGFLPQLAILKKEPRFLDEKWEVCTDEKM